MTLPALSLIFAALLQAPAAPAGLVWDGKPVHPGCIEALKTDLADALPVVVAVDLEGCRRSNRYSDVPEVDGRALRWRSPEIHGTGYFEYVYLGALSNGVQVLQVAESGGGSGVFQGLLFTRIGEIRMLEGGQLRTRQSLTLVGSESLGDRDQATIQLEGETVTIRRREFRGALGFGPEETIRRVVR